MTVVPVQTPAWAGVFIEWMHFAALVCAIALPLLRGVIRKINGHLPCFQTSFVIHDIASGLTLPSFFALALTGISPQLASHVEGHAAILAGLMGIAYTLANIIKGHGDEKRADANGNGGASKF